MNLLDHYYILFIGAFASKLGDMITLFVMRVWNFIIWEIRTYHSTHMYKKTECERLLNKVNQTYWFCTQCRSYVHNELTPTGFILGKGGYIAYISILETKESMENPKYTITLYGWWSIQELLTDEILSHSKKGEYNIVRSMGESHYIKTTDDYNPLHFHRNCSISANAILAHYNENKIGTYLLYGKPGLGKTTTARILAKKMNAWLCLDFEECCTNYNDSLIISFEKMYNYIQPDSLNPMILVIDELEDFLFTHKKFDSVDMIENKTKTNELCFKNRNTKRKWVRLMDSIQDKKHVLFLFTTNKPKEFFDEIDPALLREHRISMCLHYLKDDVQVVPFINKHKKKLKTK